MKSKKHRCSICGGDFLDGEHNAQPINNERCCGICNTVYVIPARLDRLARGEPVREVREETR